MVGGAGERFAALATIAVVLLGLDHLERAVGDQRVVAPGREQFFLPASGAGAHVADRADDQRGGERGRRLAPGGVGGERGVWHLGVEDPAAQLVIPQAPE